VRHPTESHFGGQCEASDDGKQSGGANMPRLSLKDRQKLRRGFAARLANLSDACGVRTDMPPQSGDLVKVRVDRLGHHQKLETPEGRRSHLHVGDEIVLAYAARYATDQFHAVVPKDLGSCHMIAAGGLVGKVINRHSSSRAPTEVTPIGLLCDDQNRVLNLTRYAKMRTETQASPAPPLITVVGTSMNAGKTTTAGSIVRAARRQGLDVCAIKATGTGAGGDIWKYVDSGATQSLDFAHAGLASTFQIPKTDLFDAVDHLLALGGEADLIVCELADGLLQQETRALLEGHQHIRRTEGLVLAAGDALSAKSGMDALSSMGLSATAVSGAMTASALVIEEAQPLLSKPVLSINDILNDELALARILARSPRLTLGEAA